MAALGLGFRVYRAHGLGLGISGLGLRISGLGLRVLVLGRYVTCTSGPKQPPYHYFAVRIYTYIYIYMYRKDPLYIYIYIYYFSIYLCIMQLHGPSGKQAGTGFKVLGLGILDFVL